MYETLGPVTLKSGETVEAAVVRGPDAAWRERISRLLGHKGEIWRWQNTELLARETGIEAWFYLLHRHGVPFAHILTAELAGAGLLGHVWTEPPDRGQGAAEQLMQRQLTHFRQRHGRALCLSAAHGSVAYHLYIRHGFHSIEPGSGYMIWTREPAAEFESEYFAPGPTTIAPVDWPHWPTAPFLFTAAIPGIVRCAPLDVFGRQSTEAALLPPIQERSTATGAARVSALVKPNGAVVGLAAQSSHPTETGAILVDVFCHPAFWSQAGVLLQRTLEQIPQPAFTAYADSTCPQKAAVLQTLGFEPAGTHPDGWSIFRRKSESSSPAGTN